MNSYQRSYLHMEKKQRFSLRKTTRGLVSAAIAGVFITPLFGNVAFAEQGGDDAEEQATHQQIAQPPTYDVTQWTANTVQEIEQEIQNQLDEEDSENNDYTIQWGDTVWGISQAFDLDMQAFVDANNIEDPDLIYADDVVTLDVANGVSGSEQTTEEAPAEESEENTEEAPAEGEETKESEQTTEETEESASNAVEEIDTQNDVAKQDVSDTSDTTEDAGNTETEDVAEDAIIAPEPDAIVEKEQDETDRGNFESVTDGNDEDTDNQEDTVDEDDVDVDEDLDEEEEEEEIEKPVEDEDNQESEDIIDEEIIEDDNDVTIPDDVGSEDGDVIDEEIVDETPVPSEPSEPEVPEDNDENTGEEDSGQDGEQGEQENDDQDQDVIVDRVITRTNVITHGVQYIEDDSIPAGETVIQTEGVDGQRVQTFEQRVVNNNVESETLINSEVTIEPVDEVVLVGTQTSTVERTTVQLTQPYETEYVENDQLEEGVENVIQEGITREIEQVYEKTIINGQPGREVLVDENVIVEGQPRIIEVGTKIIEEEEEKDEGLTDNDFQIDHAVFNQEMLSLVNELRTAVGVDPLAYSETLQHGADLRSADLVEIGGLRVDGEAHVRPDGSDWVNAFDYLDYGYSSIGENLASTYISLEDIENVEAGNINNSYEKGLAQKIITQYRMSPGHYENMINSDYTNFSTSVRLTEDGKLFNAQIFQL